MNTNFDYKTEFDRVAERMRILLNRKIHSDKNITQSKLGIALAKSQNAINNWLTSNEKYKCLPSGVDLLLLCKVLDIDPGLFLSDVDVDLLSFEPEVPELPFVQTRVYKKLKRLLTYSYTSRKAIRLMTLEKNGTTRCLQQIAREASFRIELWEGLPEPVRILKDLKYRLKIADIEDYLNHNRILLVFENAELFPQGAMEKIINRFSPTQSLTFVFKHTGPSSREFTSQIEPYYIKSISPGDLWEIADKWCPGLPARVISVIEALSRGRINELVDILKRIKDSEINPGLLTRTELLKLV